MEAVGVIRRSGHLGEADTSGAGTASDACASQKATVGDFANGPQGLPVLGVDASADPEVSGVGHLELTEGQLIGVAVTQIGGGERRRQAGAPPPQERWTAPEPSLSQIRWSFCGSSQDRNPLSAAS
jgi:hypothetical protein